MLSFLFCYNLVLPVSASNIIYEPTLGELETQVFSYLSESHPEVLTNTKTYVEFLLEQLMTEADPQLAAFENYDDICVYMSRYLYQMQTVPVTEGENFLLSLPSAASVLTPSEIRIAVSTQDAEFLATIDSQSQVQTISANNYNATQAVAYAREWGNARNPIYNSYLSDCTNFVSQCLVAGGIPMEKPTGLLPTGIYGTTDYWYSIRYEEWHGNSYQYKWHETSSFINVDDLNTYLFHIIISVIESGNIDAVQNYAQPGDIVQLKNSGGDWYHSIIITGGTTGNRTYCGHSTNRIDYPVSSITNTTEFRIISIKY